MSDENKTEEKNERSGETVAVNLEELKTVVAEEATRAANEAIEAAGGGKVDQSRVAITPEGEKVERSDGKPTLALPYGGGARLASPTAPLYRGLPEWEREFRNEDTDHWCAEWFRGTAKLDIARQSKAHDEIAKIYGRDLNTTSDASLIPSPIAASVMEIKRKIQKFGSLQNIQRYVSESGTLKVPKELTFAAIQRPNEGNAPALGPVDPTFGDITLTKRNAVVFTAASQDMLDDTPFSLVQNMSRGSARSLALEDDLQDVETGDGLLNNQTDALINTGNAIAFSVAGTLTYLEINKLYRLMPSEYRSDAVFIGNNTVAGFIDNVIDANGRPMFGGDSLSPPGALEGGQGGFTDGAIKRRPFLEVPITANVLLLASPSAYAVLEGGGIRAEVSRDIRFLEDQIVYKWVERRDGAVGQAAGVAKTPVITASA